MWFPHCGAIHKDNPGLVAVFTAGEVDCESWARAPHPLDLPQQGGPASLAVLQYIQLVDVGELLKLPGEVHDVKIDEL